MIDESNANTLWLESANENFQHALETNDVAVAKAVIADTMDAGFTDEARAMAVILRGHNIVTK